MDAVSGIGAGFTLQSSLDGDEGPVLAYLTGKNWLHGKNGKNPRS